MKCNSIFQHRCATICAMCGWKGFICFPFRHQLLAARLFHNTHTHAYVNETLESPTDPIKQGSVKRKLLLDCFLITSSFASSWQAGKGQKASQQRRSSKQETTKENCIKPDRQQECIHHFPGLSITGQCFNQHSAAAASDAAVIKTTHTPTYTHRDNAFVSCL